MKAKEKLKEVEDAEIMVNMTLEAADRAMMRAMDANQRAKNASARMDQLIQVSQAIFVFFFLFANAGFNKQHQQLLLYL